MAKVICENCGRSIRDTDVKCLYCNTINVHRIRDEHTYLDDNRDPLGRESLPRMSNSDNIYREKSHQAAPTVHKIDFSFDNNVDAQYESRDGMRSSKRKSIVPILITIVVLSLIVFGAASLYLELDYLAYDKKQPDAGYYIHNNELYYFDDYAHDLSDAPPVSRWWHYDAQADAWSIYSEFSYDDPRFLFDFSDDDVLWEYEVEDVLGLDAELINIRLSKEYIDAGHHYRPTDGYYFQEGIAYYYLSDYYSVDKDVSGWYKFDREQSTWRFYCNYQNKDLLGDILYYYPDSAYVGDSDASWKTTGIEPPLSFHNTEWYAIYMEHDKAYKEKYD